MDAVPFCPALPLWKKGGKGAGPGNRHRHHLLILLTAKTEGSRTLPGLEIQERVHGHGRRSIGHNHLEGKVDIVTGDIVEASRLFCTGFL